MSGGRERRGRPDGRARRRRAVGALWLIAVIALAPASAMAEERSIGAQAAVGTGTALLNLLYIPAKLVYALMGGLVGGLTWGLTLGDTETANRVWEPTLGGSYILSPQVLTGEQPLRFSGGDTGPTRIESKSKEQWPE